MPGVHRDYIVQKLGEALGGPASIRPHGFSEPSDRNPGTMTEVYNIVGHLPSPVDTSGAILLTAHFDATGTRSDPDSLCAAGLKDDDWDCNCADAQNDADCQWNPLNDPAPGADDNATGVAALIEAARLLAPLTFDFDLYFVAFQAEEIGLKGSAAFADSVAGADQEIYAVLNMDMIGYNLQPKLQVITDESSQWFADWIEESGNVFVPDLPITKFIEPFGRSDHASFWARGIDAVVILEDKEIPYPGYHDVKDTWELMVSGRDNPERQLLNSVQIAVATIARFSLHSAAPDLAIPPGELVAAPSIPSHGFVQGESALITARVRNLGNSSLTYLGQTTDSLTARVRFFDGDPDAGGAPIGELTQKDLYLSGGQNDFRIAWEHRRGGARLPYDLGDGRGPRPGLRPDRRSGQQSHLVPVLPAGGGERGTTGPRALRVSESGARCSGLRSTISSRGTPP